MIMLPVMFKNSWFPTVFDEFLNNDFAPSTCKTMRTLGRNVARMESMPVCGVAMRNEAMAPFEAFSLRSPMAVGIYPFYCAKVQKNTNCHIVLWRNLLSSHK